MGSREKQKEMKYFYFFVGLQQQLRRSLKAKKKKKKDFSSHHRVVFVQPRRISTTTKKKGFRFSFVLCRFILFSYTRKEEKRNDDDDDDSLGLPLSDGPEQKKETQNYKQLDYMLSSTYPNWIGGRKKKE
jgi:hypothetical protein